MLYPLSYEGEIQPPILVRQLPRQRVLLYTAPSRKVNGQNWKTKIFLEDNSSYFATLEVDSITNFDAELLYPYHISLGFFDL